MGEFDVTIDSDGNAIATHRVHRHEYHFTITPTELYIAGGTVRQSQTADRDYAEVFIRARDAVLSHARAKGFISK
jgi:hypothetical protein